MKPTTMAEKPRQRPTVRRKSGAVRVMLVDDHPLWRDTLRKVLERKGFATVVAEAGDGEEAVQRAGGLDVDVVLMDIQLPDTDGIQATRNLVAAQPRTRVLALSSSDSRTQVLAAIEAGASGYLLKTAGSDEVRDAVRRVHAGELVFPPALTNVVLDELRNRQSRREGAAGDSLRREGDVWAISFQGHEFRLKDTRGVRFLAELLRNPGREFHALDLVVGDRFAAGLGGDADAGPVLDSAAKASYRRRLTEMQEELDEAESWEDLDRAARLRDEIEALRGELSAAVGLGGRDRRAASTAERARVNVTLAIRATLNKMADYSPELFRHLSSTIKTGTYCSYTPDSRAPVSWIED